MIDAKLLQVAQDCMTISDSKEAIRQAINAKGVEVLPADTLASYPDKIAAIPTGGGVQTGHRVRYFDYEGTLLKTEIVPTGTPISWPAIPAHPRLTFLHGNIAQSGTVDRDTDVGLIYAPTSGNTELDVVFTSASSSRAIYLNVKKSDGTLMTVNWGDGQTTTTYVSGWSSILHTYGADGNYTISIVATSPYGLGSGYSGTTAISPANSKCLVSAFLSEITSVSAYGFDSCLSLREVVISNIFYSNAFSNCRTLGHINMPQSLQADIPTYSFHMSKSLKRVILPYTVTAIRNSAFGSCTSLIEIIIPESVTIFEAGIFSSCYYLKNIKANYAAITLPSASFIDYCYALEGSPRIPEGTTNPGSYYTNQYLLREAYIPNSVVAILSSTFANCYSIPNIDVPASVTSIGNGAFTETWSVKQYIFRSISPPTAGTTIFGPIGNLSPTVKIYVPDASVAAYKAATNWITYAAYIYPLSQLPA